MRVPARMIDVLPEETIESIRSTVVIPTFAAAVRELIHNALDAGASDIEVKLSMISNDIEVHVIDNGRGFNKNELSSIGTRYADRGEVKAIDLRRHGKHGEVLASLAHLGELQITSSVKGREPSLKLTYRDGRLRLKSCAASSTPGTTVIIRNLFHNVPVRRQAALSNLLATTTSITKTFQVAALSAPACKMRLLKIHQGKVKVLAATPGSTDTLQTFRALYGLDMTLEVELLHGRFALQATRIDGFISLIGSTTPGYQFFYINGHYSIGSAAAVAFLESFKRCEMNSLLGGSGLSKAHTTYRPEVHPVFVLDISTTEQMKNDQLIDLVDAVCARFLARHSAKLDKAKGLRSLTLPSLQSKGRHIEIEPSRSSRQVRTSHTPSETDSIKIKVEAPTSGDRLDPAGLQHPAVKGRWLDRALKSMPMPGIIRSHSSLDAHNSHKQLPAAFSSNLGGSAVSIDRQQLQTAKVIAQLADKFILCLTWSKDSPSPRLILVDQHAASERIGLEKLLTAIVDAFLDKGLEKYTLAQDFELLITARWQVYLQDEPCAAILARWGIALSPTSPGSSHWKVESVAKIFRTRLAAPDAPELMLFLRDFFDYWEQHGRSNLETDITAGKINRRHAQVMMPKEMSELVNSMACRGAIMFGDQLTRAECSSLIADLAKTDFPFICAHGRPSMVPITALSPSEIPRSIDWSQL